MIVMVKLRLLAFVVAGMAIGAVTRPMFTAPEVVFWCPLDVIRDDQVEPPVLIVVKPSCAGGPHSFVCHPRLDGNIGEPSLAIVVVQDSAAVARDIYIRIPVVVRV